MYIWFGRDSTVGQWLTEDSKLVILETSTSLHWVVSSISAHKQLTGLRVCAEIGRHKGGREQSVAQLCLTSPPVLVAAKGVVGPSPSPFPTDSHVPVVQDRDDLPCPEGQLVVLCRLKVVDGTHLLHGHLQHIYSTHCIMLARQRQPCGLGWGRGWWAWRGRGRRWWWWKKQGWSHARRAG